MITRCYRFRGVKIQSFSLYFIHLLLSSVFVTSSVFPAITSCRLIRFIDLVFRALVVSVTRHSLALVTACSTCNIETCVCARSMCIEFSHGSWELHAKLLLQFVFWSFVEVCLVKFYPLKLDRLDVYQCVDGMIVLIEWIIRCSKCNRK